MRIKTLLFLISLVFMAPTFASPPTVEYSADWQMETDEGVMLGKIYNAPDKERRDFTMSGQSMLMIMRRDKNIIWNLMPNERMYMEMKPEDSQSGGDDLDQYNIEQTVVGEEVINGVRTTKGKIIMTGKNPKLGKMGGFWWKTPQDIVMKLDVIAVDRNEKDRIKMELDNLNIGTQDPALFEIPPGYTSMSMGMMGMGKMGMGALLGGGDDEDENEPVEAKPKSRGFGLKDALDLLK